MCGLDTVGKGKFSLTDCDSWKSQFDSRERGGRPSRDEARVNEEVAEIVEACMEVVQAPS